MQCPLCPTQLKMGEDGLVKCARFHRFRLVMDDKGYRELVHGSRSEGFKGITDQR